MIHEIGVELQAALRVQGVPLVVVDGPEDSQTATWGRERIVIQYDESGSDKFALPRSQSDLKNRRRYDSAESCKITIYAQSSAAGANEFEHRRRAKHIRDVVLPALELIARNRKNRFTPTTGQLITPQDLQATQRAGGAVYEIKFTYERGIETRTFAGAARPTATLAGVTSITKVSREGDAAEDPNAPPADAETACGA